MKKYIAIVGAICAVSLTIVVALRIAPEAWATIAGIFFGGLASVPMCFIALMLIRNQSGVRPAASGQPAPPQQIIIVREPTALPRYRQQQYVAAPSPYEYGDDEYIEGDYYEQPAAPRPQYGTRLVNQPPTGARVIGNRR